MGQFHPSVHILFCWTAEPRKLRSICLNAVDTEYWCDRTVKSVVFKHSIDPVIGIPFACIVDYNGTFYFVNPKYALNWEHTFLCIHWCFKKLFDFYMSSQVCSYSMFSGFYLFLSLKSLIIHVPVIMRREDHQIIVVFFKDFFINYM